MITPFVPPYYITLLPPPIWSGVDDLPVLPHLPGRNVKISKGPMWSGQVIKTASGRRRPTSYWPFPLWQFSISYDVIRGIPPTQDELSIMWEFYNTMSGPYGGTWLYADRDDAQLRTSALQDNSTGAPLLDPATHQPETDPGSPYPLGYTFAIGDGATRVFQLSRFVNSWVEPVANVFQPLVMDNGVYTPGAYTVANGQVTFSSAPLAGHALSWFGYFYFQCAFVDDTLSFDQIVRQLWSGKGLKFESIRV